MNSVKAPSPALPNGKGEPKLHSIQPHPLTPPIGRGEIQDADLNFVIGKDFMQYETNPRIFKHLSEIRRYLKENETPTEKIIWKNIRAAKLGCHFRRQHIVNNFIVDFVCLEKRLILEIDGKIHDYQKESDAERQDILESFGFKFLRFKNEEVLNTIEMVLQKIKGALLQTENQATTLNFPLPVGKGRGWGRAASEVTTNTAPPPNPSH